MKIKHIEREEKMNKNDNKEKKLSKTIRGAVIGLACGIFAEFMMIIPLMSNWPIRSIVVALSVAGIVWSLVGGFIGRNIDKHFAPESL